MLKDDIPDIKSGGYKIKLTIDLDAQEIARKALKKSYEEALKRDQYFRKTSEELDNDSYVKTLNGAIVSMESNTGKILALVGGVSYKESMFNRAVQSKRQPGSAIKPFIYQTALNKGLNPASELVDISRTYDYKVDGIDKKWQPRNYGGNFKGVVNLRESLISSRNLSTINLVTDSGINVAYKGLQSYGFKDLPKDLSITLGTMSVTLLELSEYYSVFANNGTQVKPFIVEQITNKNNETIIFEPQSKKVNTPEQTFLITSILKDVVKRGTARRARVKGIELAGKTGTTNNNIDAWFCGYSPSVQTIVWFGNDDNKPMRKTETGGRIAAPAFSYFNKYYLKSHPEIPRKFIKPEKVYSSKVNGKIEYYTKTSPLPEIEISSGNSNQEAIEF